MPVNQPQIGLSSSSTANRVYVENIVADRYQASGSAKAYIRFDNNGTVYISNSYGAVGDIVAFNWLLLGTNSDYEIKATLVDSDGSVVGTFGNWLSLGSDNTWSITANAVTGPLTATISFRIRDAVTLTELVAPFTGSLSTTVG